MSLVSTKKKTNRYKDSGKVEIGNNGFETDLISNYLGILLCSERGIYYKRVKLERSVY